MSKPRVLFVCQHFWPESFRINDIADFFVEKECEIDVLCGIPNYPKGKFFADYGYFKNRKQEHNGVKIRRAFEIPRGKNTNIGIFLNYISFPVASIFHVPKLLTRKYDKIFIYQLSPVMMSIAGILIGKIKRTETTMYVLDLWPENLYSVLNIKNSLLRRLLRSVSLWHYKHADKLIVLSERTKLHLVKTCGVDSSKVTILPQTSEKIYEKDIYDAVIAKRFATGFNILYAGNISPAQSFETVIEAANTLKSKGINDINWIVVGDGMSKSWLMEEVTNNSLEDMFYFEGIKPVTDIPKYNAVADLLLGCLVRSELLEATIPAKVMSYIASGKPMALAMDGEVSKLVNDTIKCGLVSPAGDAEALAINIEKLHSLPEKERLRMGKNARAYHFKHFERNISLTKLYNFIFS